MVNGSLLLLDLSLLMTLGLGHAPLGSCLSGLLAFLGSLHWPAAGADLGVGGVSFVEVLILYELWAGERVVLEKAVPRYRGPGRPFFVSAVLVGPGTNAFVQVHWGPFKGN